MKPLVALCVILLGVTSNTEAKDLVCHNCFDVASPEDCQQFVTCGKDEMCYTREFTDHNGKRAYHLGCESPRICSILKNAQTLLGKRLARSMESEVPSVAASTRDAHRCYHCCGQDLCNVNVCDARCPHGFVNSPTRCYHFSRHNVTWHEARQECQKKAADLVSINTAEEYQFLRNNTPAKAPSLYWTGGFYQPRTNVWQWVDGTVANYFEWYPGYPKHAPNATDYRLTIYTVKPEKFTLFESVETSYKSFICEKDHSLV
ncbi:C-type lectin domain family 10 member A-like [Haliotis rufescens]|uniref:C-type lectin domain family 10 member A-like n=1 Tax=Haliotis rufescens TaxID=6454 RepID=UPI00201F2027|nr:C-type lectin domain family 10 member A-like [Haliotis rufescens]